MASPISKGRMLRQDISKSKRFASLSDDAKIIFCMVIPHLNSHGKANGSPHFIKGEMVPLLDYSIKDIEKCMKEISRKTNVKWFKQKGLYYIHSLNFSQHQELRDDRMGSDLLPDYSRTSPGPLPPEVEVKDEVKEEGKVKSLNVKSNGASRTSEGKDTELVDEIVAFCDDEKSRSMYILAEKNLGEGLLRELFGEVKMRLREGAAISNPGAYLTKMITEEANMRRGQ